MEELYDTRWHCERFIYLDRSIFSFSWISTGVPVRWKRGNPQLRRPSHSETFAWFAQKTGKQGSMSMDVSAIFYLVNSISFSLSHSRWRPDFYSFAISTLSRNPCTFLTLHFSFFLFPLSFFILVLVVDVEESILFSSVFWFSTDRENTWKKKSNFCGNINFCKISVIDGME